MKLIVGPTVQPEQQIEIRLIKTNLGAEVYLYEHNKPYLPGHHIGTFVVHNDKIKFIRVMDVNTSLCHVNDPFLNQIECN